MGLRRTHDAPIGMKLASFNLCHPERAQRVEEPARVKPRGPLLVASNPNFAAALWPFSPGEGAFCKRSTLNGRG